MEKKLLTDDYIFNPAKMKLYESKEPNGGLIIEGEFGYVNKKNINGRIYPKPIMEREIKKMNKLIKARNKGVLGELDHPCFTEDNFRILTENGWKDFKDVLTTDMVWSNVNGKAVLSSVEEIVNEPYSGPVARVVGKNIDSTFTLPHRFLLSKRPDVNGDSKHFYATLSEIIETPGKFGHSAIPKIAQWDIPTSSTVTVKGTEKLPDVNVDAKVFSAFMGLYLSEGHIVNEDSDYSIYINQKLDWSKEFMYNEVLSKFPSDIKWLDDVSGFRVTDKRLWLMLNNLGDCYSKCVPDYVKCLDVKCLQDLVFWFSMGDGNKLFLASKKLTDDLHECIVKSGRSATSSIIYPDKDYTFANHVIKADSKIPLYQITLSDTSYIWLDPRLIKHEHKTHDGNIFCIKTTHGNFYVEHNNKTFWTGNSDGKTKLHRSSHMVEEVWLEGDIIHGKARVIGTVKGKDLQALYDAKAPVGISQRGYGSTIPDSSGSEIIQEDYELKTWDFVEDPSAEVYPEEVQAKKEDIEVDASTVVAEEVMSDKDDEKKKPDEKTGKEAKNKDTEKDDQEVIGDAQGDNASEIANDLEINKDDEKDKEDEKDKDDEQKESEEEFDTKVKTKTKTKSEDVLESDKEEQEVNTESIETVRELVETVRTTLGEIKKLKLEKKDELALDQVKKAVALASNDESVNKLMEAIEQDNLSLQEQTRTLQEENFSLKSKVNRLSESLDASMRRLIYEQGLTVVGIHNQERFDELVGDDRFSKGITELKEAVGSATKSMSEEENILLQDDLIDTLNTFVESDNTIKEELETVKKEKAVLLEEKIKKDKIDTLYNECDAEGLLEGYGNKGEIKLLLEHCNNVTEASEIISKQGVALRSNKKYNNQEGTALVERLRSRFTVSKQHLTEQMEDLEIKPERVIVEGVDVDSFNQLSNVIN